MNEHFLNGREVTVAVGGEVLGGVLYAETGSRTEAVKVEEYLNPDPVARLPRTVYRGAAALGGGIRRDDRSG